MVDILLALAIFASPPQDCQLGGYRSGHCVDGSFAGDGVELHGDLRNGPSGNTVELDDAHERPEKPTLHCERRMRDQCAFSFSTSVPSAITVEDLAAFPVQPGGLTSEPRGWAVLGLPANLISDAAPHTVDGTLLDRPATVRFTPVAWTWDYGDGTTARTSTGGGTWTTLGRNEFDPTPTGHTYTTRGTYRVHADVTFTAAYRFDSGTWIPIPGTLTVPATTELTLRTVTARTALVSEDCHNRPTGPGC